MKKISIIIFFVAWIFLGALPVVAQKKDESRQINQLDIRGLEATVVARLMTNLTGQPVVVTQGARNRTIDISLAEVSLESALKAICRSANLVYRYDPESGIYTLMELDEYQKSTNGEAENLFVTETFRVEPGNLRQIAYTLESLFGERIFFTEGENPENFATDLSGGFGNSAFGLSNSAEGFDANNGGFLGVNDGQATSFNSSQTTFSSFGQSSFRGRGAGLRGGRNAIALEPSQISSEAALDAETARSKAGTDNTVNEVERRARARGNATVFVTTNPEHSLLIVRTADRAVLKEISDLVRQLNEPIAQVILEMKVLQLDVGDGLTTGVSWRGLKGDEFFEITERDPKTGRPTSFEYIGKEQNLSLGKFASESAATFAYEYISEELRARVDMLASDNRVEVIATPMLTATNNRAAQIRVGEERIITVGASTERNIAGETGTRNDFITVETEKRTIGTTVRIIPRINQDQTVTLNVFQEATTLKPRNNSIQVGNQTIPIDSVDTAAVRATVVAKDGNTVALGGLIRNETTNNKQKVPLLGDIPLLGRAFRKDVSGTRKTELILLITPRLLNKGQQNGGTNAMAESEKLMDRLSDNRWHTAGEVPIEEDNPQLQRYRRDRQRYDDGKNELKTNHWQQIEKSNDPSPEARSKAFDANDKATKGRK